MEGSDSRKRPLDAESDNGVIKRSNQGVGKTIQNIRMHFFLVANVGQNGHSSTCLAWLADSAQWSMDNKHAIHICHVDCQFMCIAILSCSFHLFLCLFHWNLSKWHFSQGTGSKMEFQKFGSFFDSIKSLKKSMILKWFRF